MTAPLTLWGLPYSAYCVKVRIALRLKGIAFEEVPPPDGYRSDAYRTHVPTGTIPALDVGGQVLVESNAIVEYLDEIHPDPPLLPADALARTRSRAAAGYHDTRLEPVMRPLFPLLGQPELDIGAFDGVATTLADRLARLEEMFSPGAFIVGPNLTLGDLGFPWTLTMAGRLLAEAGVNLSFSPAVRSWIANVSAVPAVAETLAEADAGLTPWLAEKAANRQA